MVDSPIKFVAFDLDGTLLRGNTVCEVIARELGKLNRMREFERFTTREKVTVGRREMAEWYDAAGTPTLLSFLPNAIIAPGAVEAFEYLRQAGRETAIVSITWGFAVEWFAERFGADYWVGTGYSPHGEVTHFWPEDKPKFVKKITDESGIGMKEVAAIGDSSGDVPMLRAVGRSAFVGADLPDGFTPDIHVPGGDILRVIQELVG